MRMASSLCLALVAAAAALADGGAVPARYRSLGRHRAPPSRGAQGLPAPRFVTQRVDHFDGANADTWRQAYFVNDTYFQPGSTAPVFLCVGGEGPPLDGSAVVDSVHCNVAVEWLRTTGALMFALEHRYYGCHNASACPVANLSAPGALRFLSSRQALGDIAGFVRAANDEYSLSVANKWVTWGGSYPGMLAGWARLKFPHLIYASVASSAPVRAELDMRGYNDVVAAAYAVSHEGVGGSPACRAAIAEGHRRIGELFGSAEGRATLAGLFGQSAEWYADTGNQRGFAGEGVADFPAQANDPACAEPMCNIARICEAMTNASVGDEVSRLALVRKAQAGAGGAAAEDRVAEDPTPGYNDGDLLWPWQTCTEFGFYQTCEQDSDCFFTRGLSDLQGEMAFCSETFGISPETVAQNVEYTNAYYGSDTPSGSRVLFTNGEVDPWHANSINSPLSPGLPALYVEGASHHAWTHPTLPTDQGSVVAARRAIRDTVTEFLAQEPSLAATTLVV